jgi:hypothetical protein
MNLLSGWRRRSTKPSPRCARRARPRSGGRVRLVIDTNNLARWRGSGRDHTDSLSVTGLTQDGARRPCPPTLLPFLPDPNPDLSTTKCNPLLSPPAISVPATASEEHEKHEDNQNGCHGFLQNTHRGDFPACMWVRNHYVTSLGIYLVATIRRRNPVRMAEIQAGTPASVTSRTTPRH